MRLLTKILIPLFLLMVGNAYAVKIETDQVIFTNAVTFSNNVNHAGQTISNANFVGNGSGLTNLPASNPWTLVRSTTPYSTTNFSSATMASATNLGFTMTANTAYLIQGWINHTSSVATIGVWLGVRGPAYTTLSGKFCAPMATITDANIPVITTNVCAAPSTSSFDLNNNLDTFDCYYVCGATNGYFNIAFAAEVAGSVGIKTNSVLQYRTIP